MYGAACLLYGAATLDSLIIDTHCKSPWALGALRYGVWLGSAG